MAQAKPLRQQFIERLPHHVSGRITKNSLSAFIEHGDSTVGTDRDDRLRGDVDDAGQAFLRCRALVSHLLTLDHPADQDTDLGGDSQQVFVLFNHAVGKEFEHRGDVRSHHHRHRETG